MTDKTCQYFGKCAVCEWHEKPLLMQQELKRQHLRDQFLKNDLHFDNEIKLTNLGPNHLRTRADLTVQNGKIGFYSANESNQILDILECNQMSHMLQDAFAELRKFALNIKKGSIRIRVSPTGKFGLWLDFSNLDIKSLFEEKKTLLSLLDRFEVEVGQKRKKLYLQLDKLRLKDSDLLPWTQSFTTDSKIDLYSQIGAFSQTGPDATAAIAKLIHEHLGRDQKIAEFGCGIGTFTFTLAEHNQVKAFEIDGLALLGLKKTLLEQIKFQSHIQLQAGNFHKKESSPRFEDFDLVFLNPARSGVGDFLENLPYLKTESQLGPSKIMYLSCFPESFVRDSLVIQQKGYALNMVEIVDQFPLTHHYEIFSVWTPAQDQ